MSGGSQTAEHRLDVQCKHCGRYYRNDGIHAHQRYCPFSEVDETIVPLEGKRDDRDVSPSDEGETSEPPQDDETIDGQNTVEDPDPRETVETDGGPRPPPEPELDQDVDQDDQDDDRLDEDDLGDRYVTVEEYIDTIRKSEKVDADQLRRRLSGFDVIDLEETTATEIKAYTSEEINDPI
jgi:hypothetical protein